MTREGMMYYIFSTKNCIPLMVDLTLRRKLSYVKTKPSGKYYLRKISVGLTHSTVMLNESEASHPSR